MINNIIAREILDSRGNPTVEVDVILNNGICGRASVPSGASTGSLEAIELRDQDPKRFLGKGVLKALKNISHIITPALIGKSPLNQREIDQLLIELDGTENKANLGANATLAVSLAIAKASSLSQNLPLFRYLSPNQDNYILPKTLMNIINGGAHADNLIAIQEFMIIPNISNSVKESVRVGAEVFHNLKSILNKSGYSTNVGDEGGFAPNLVSANHALDYIIMAIKQAGFEAGKDIMIGLDCAATEFYHNGIYNIAEDKKLRAEELTSYYQQLAQNYPITYIEDPMAEDDFNGWKLVTEKLGGSIMVVGDDLFVTNQKMLANGIKSKLANSILIKPNQIGTLTETMDTIEMAKAAGYKAIISHRSGETEDTMIAHLAVATNVGYIKTGSLSRTDRLAKYNELMRIEEILSY